MFRLVAAFSLACVGCATTSRDPGGAPPPPPKPEPTLTFESGGIPLPEDATWQRSAGGDPLDLGRLARRAGARELIEIAERGGPVGAIALDALALAPDARAERARACELLTDVRRDERPLVLGAVHRILTEAPVLHEALAPGANAICNAQLRALLGDEQLAPAERDLAESALAALAWGEG